eukprot:2879314-Amphidinium_carterae.1
MPKRGTFKCTYVCAPEDRNFKFRAELLQTCAEKTFKLCGLVVVLAASHAASGLSCHSHGPHLPEHASDCKPSSPCFAVVWPQAFVIHKLRHIECQHPQCSAASVYILHLALLFCGAGSCTYPRYGYWTLKNVTADDVMWWSGLKEAPMDVIDYLEFLVSRYSNIYKPFYIIDGEDGNGEITLREFEVFREGVVMLTLLSLASKLHLKCHQHHQS